MNKTQNKPSIVIDVVDGYGSLDRWRATLRAMSDGQHGEFGRGFGDACVDFLNVR